MSTCRTCGRPLDGSANRHVRRCIPCRVAAAMRGWSYTPDPYAVVEYREDETRWAARGGEEQ